MFGVDAPIFASVDPVFHIPSKAALITNRSDVGLVDLFMDNPLPIASCEMNAGLSLRWLFFRRFGKNDDIKQTLFPHNSAKDKLLLNDEPLFFEDTLDFCCEGARAEPVYLFAIF